MTEGPDNGVNDQFELVRGHGEKGAEAVVGDGPQQAEELQPVLRELLHGNITADHPHHATLQRLDAIWGGLTSAWPQSSRLCRAHHVCSNITNTAMQKDIQEVA